MSTDKAKAAQSCSSVTSSNNGNYDSNSHISHSSRLKVDSTLTTDDNFQPPAALVGRQAHFSMHNSSFGDLNYSMSRLSTHDAQPMNRNNWNRGRSQQNYLYHHSGVQLGVQSGPSPVTPPDAQAQLVAFTPSLMSIQLSRREHHSYEPNHYHRHSYMHNQLPEQPNVPAQYKSKTVVPEPEYYIDSFASNFSDKPSSNSNTKTKTKHVTFQEPDSTNNLLASQSDHFPYAASPPNSPLHSSQYFTPTTHLYPSVRSNTRFYNPYQHPMHNQYPLTSHTMIGNPRYMTHPRFMNSASPSQLRTQQPYHANHRVPFTEYRFQPKQLYDPNKPKTPTPHETHNVPNVIRSIVPKNKKRNRQVQSDSNSTASTSDFVSHPITILRKPTNGAQSITILQPRTLVAQDQSVTSLDEEQTIQSVNVDCSNTLCREQSLLEDLPELSHTEEETIAPVIENESVPQSTSKPVLSLSGPEILSVLQSANCLASLNDFAQQKKFSLNYEFSSIPPSSFTCQVIINNRAFTTSAACSSKVEAQKLACDQALRTLYLESCIHEPSILEFSDKHDHIAHQSVSKFQSLKVNDLLFGRKTLACMLMVIDEQYAQANVISVATGNTCLDETNLAYADDGVALHDCHAEVLARRGFIRYLFKELQQCHDKQTSIFKYNSTMNKFQLRANVTFHLYISSIPCGSASVDASTTSIRYKQGKIEGTVLASASSKKCSIKSCSDKIYRWNMLGIQGGLLISLLTEPIYLSTITIACETRFDRDHVKYALCERLNEHIHSLPSPFVPHVPDIDCPESKSLQKEREVAKLQSNAFAWNITQPDRMELLEPMTGKLKSDRSMSLLSKQSLFDKFTNFIQTNFPDDPSLTFTTYQEAKQLNKAYVTVKTLISEAFQTGTSDSNAAWFSKSDQVEQFSVE